MILLVCLILLILSFTVHLLWWRIKMPTHTTGVLLLIFFAMPIAYAIYLFCFEHAITLSLYEHTRLILLYVSCSFIYVIVYSAIEQQSPTLGMVSFIDQHHALGCTDNALMDFLNVDDEIKKRLSLMARSGWLTYKKDRWYLTKSGRRIARIFQCAASIFGLKRGG